ncbi:MAG: hypothetical protein V1851_00185 [Patescibacteria group bacterium]
MTLNVSVTDEQLGHYYRRISAIAGRLGKSLDFQKVMDSLQEIHDNEFKTENKFLARLYLDEEIWISETTGEKTIAQSSDVFKGWIDSDFINWGTDKQGKSTERTKVEVYEMRRDATFEQMFTSLGDIDKLCFEQEQIINFCLEHPDKLRKDGYATFFLFKVHDRPFVAIVFLGSGGLEVRVYRFDYDYVWGAEIRPRVVVPQTL